MSTNGGLSRRRVPAGSSSTSADDDRSTSSPGTGTSSPRLGSPRNSTLSPSSQGGTKHAGSAFEGGSKIAYDPRDLEREGEELRKGGGKAPKLTIMEEVLLLGLKDKQGYLSFWNDNISYALRGCILIELALRRRIALVRDPHRRRLPLSERLVEVIDERATGETILDEALKMMKGQQDVEKIGVGSWVDLLSGETWNVMKIGFQLKQVRERLAKGLVDKGILRTEKRNFLLFDMATHPIADPRTKAQLITRVTTVLTSTTAAVPDAALLSEDGVHAKVVRSVCLVCAGYAASVLDNAFGRLGYEEREAAFQRCDEVLAEFACWPFGSATGTPANPGPGRRREGSRIGMGGGGGAASGRESVLGLVQAAKTEMQSPEEDLGFELVAGVLEVMSKLDSLL
ncbi:hypothetical protein HWV62_16200 [Athelia sp. TMB]|nr:hypothetical protein HWV62_16200 [Athelia sp. TMB]